MIVDRDLLTTREVARLLGVGTTSVKRWADSGLLRCVKTPGGHRRFPRDSVATFVAQQHELRGAGADGIEEQGEVWLGKLLHMKHPGEIARALQAEFRRLGSWFDVADALKGVLDEIGRAWARGDITVIQEHIVSERFARAVVRLSDSIAVPADARTCVVMAAEGDDHTLGLNLVELCMREAGWNVTWTGRKTPIHFVCEFIRSGDVDLVAVSASEYSRDTAALIDQVERLGRVCAQTSTPLLLGGMGLWPETPRYGRRVVSFAELRAVLQELRISSN